MENIWQYLDAISAQLSVINFWNSKGSLTDSILEQYYQEIPFPKPDIEDIRQLEIAI